MKFNLVYLVLVLGGFCWLGHGSQCDWVMEDLGTALGADLYEYDSLYAFGIEAFGCLTPAAESILYTGQVLRWTAPVSGRFSFETTMSTDDLDTILAVTDSSCSVDAMVCNDDKDIFTKYSLVEYDVIAGNDYFILIAGGLLWLEKFFGNAYLNIQYVVPQYECTYPTEIPSQFIINADCEGGESYPAQTKCYITTLMPNGVDKRTYLFVCGWHSRWYAAYDVPFSTLFLLDQPYCQINYEINHYGCDVDPVRFTSSMMPGPDQIYANVGTTCESRDKCTSYKCISHGAWVEVADNCKDCILPIIPQDRIASSTCGSGSAVSHGAQCTIELFTPDKQQTFLVVPTCFNGNFLPEIPVGLADMCSPPVLEELDQHDESFICQDNVTVVFGEQKLFKPGALCQRVRKCTRDDGKSYFALAPASIFTCTQGAWIATEENESLSYDPNDYSCECEDADEENITQVGCPEGWDFRNERCWKFIKETDPEQFMDFETARARCQAEGGVLASIRNQMDVEVSKSYQSQLGGLYSVWIGAKSSPASPFEFEWLDGSEFLFTNWAIYEPNSPGVENCLNLFRTGVNGYNSFGLWNDYDCGIPISAAICTSSTISFFPNLCKTAAKSTNVPTTNPTVYPTANPTSSPTVSCETPELPEGAMADCGENEADTLVYLDSCTVQATEGYSCNNDGTKYQCTDSNTWTVVDGPEVDLESAACWNDCTFPPEMEEGVTSSNCSPNQSVQHSDSCKMILSDEMHTCENLGTYMCSDGIWKLEEEDSEVTMEDIYCLAKCNVPELTEGMHTPCQGAVTSGTTCALIPDNETITCTGPETVICTDGTWIYDDEAPYDAESDNDCDIDCVESKWSEWSSCSKICGTGSQTATRTIEVYPALGGRECGELTKSQDCNTHECKCYADIVAGIDVTYDNRGQTQVQFNLARAQLLSLVNHLGDAVHTDRAHMSVSMLDAVDVESVVDFGSSESENASELWSKLTTGSFYTEVSGVTDKRTAFLEFLQNSVTKLNSANEEAIREERNTEPRQPFIVLFSDGLPQITNLRNKKAKKYIADVQAIVKGEGAPSGLKVVCYRVTARSAFHALFKDGICDIMWDFSEGTDETSVTSKTRDVIGYEMANYLCPNLETHEQGEDEDEVIQTAVANPCEDIRSPNECRGVRKESDGSDPADGERGVQFCDFQYTPYRKCAPLEKYLFLFTDVEQALIQSSEIGIQQAGASDPCFALTSPKKCNKVFVPLPTTTSRRMLKGKKAKKYKVCQWDGELCNLKTEFLASYLECSSLNQATCGLYPTLCEWDSSQCKSIDGI